MTTKPKTRKAPAVDPILAAIAAHKAAEKECLYLVNELEEAEHEAKEAHGPRPQSWIWWRSCDVFYEDHLGRRREEFLEQPGADRKQVEKEYRDAKARLAATEQEASDWDKRAGVAPLREAAERAEAAERGAARRMARTKPTTPAGASSLLAYLHADIGISLGSLADWHLIAIKTVARALARMEAAA